MESKTAHVAYTFLIIALVLFFFYIAKTVLMPFVISIFLSFMLMPFIVWLKDRKIPLLLSSLISISIVMFVIIFFSYLLMVSVKNFSSNLPHYSEQLKNLLASLILQLQGYGLKISSEEVLNSLNFSFVSSYLGRGMLSLVSVLSTFVLIFFLTLFLLIEGKRFQEKSIRIYGEKNPLLESFASIGKQIQRYILLKTILSLATGISVYVFLLLWGVRFALLWGLLAFLLNYIPTIGSIIATAPPVLVTLLQYSTLWALIVLVSLVLIHNGIGNYIEPRLLGRKLNFSPLVVFLNMIIWGVLWGPIGMLLATPLLVAIKVVVSYSENFKKIMSLLEN